jgi:hypothetical protein
MMRFVIVFLNKYSGEESRRMRQAGHLARMGEKLNVNKRDFRASTRYI